MLTRDGLAMAQLHGRRRKLDNGGLKMIVWKRGKGLLRMGSNVEVSGLPQPKGD